MSGWRERSPNHCMARSCCSWLFLRNNVKEAFLGNNNSSSWTHVLRESSEHQQHIHFCLTSSDAKKHIRDKLWNTLVQVLGQAGTLITHSPLTQRRPRSRVPTCARVGCRCWFGLNVHRDYIIMAYWGRWTGDRRVGEEGGGVRGTGGAGVPMSSSFQVS